MKSFDSEYLRVNLRRVKEAEAAPPVSMGANGLELWHHLFPFSPDEVDFAFPGGIFSHLDITESGFTFKWPTVPGAKKLRLRIVKNGLKHLWSSDSVSDPPFWPEIPEKLPDTVYFTEGESDCIIARWLGFQAWALTKGVNTPVGEKILREIAERGVRTIYLLFDDDETGRTVAQDVKQLIATACLKFPQDRKIVCHVFPIADLVNPLKGEKDLRQAALSTPDPELLGDRLLEIQQKIVDQSTSQGVWLSGSDFLERDIPTVRWIVDQVLSPATYNIVTGFPKMGKSYLSLDLAVSIATGTKFLDHFPIIEQGDVLYIAKETTEVDFQDRFKKIWYSKTAGLRSRPKHDVHLILRSDFRFDPEPLLELRDQLLLFEATRGRKIALVIVDPFSYAMPLGKFDLNSYGDFMNRVVSPCQQVITDTGVSFLTVFHQGKGEGLSALGSTAIEGAYTSKIFYREKERRTDGSVRIGLSHREALELDLYLTLNIDSETYSAKVSKGEDDFSVNLKKSTKDVKAREDEALEIIYQSIPDEEFSFKDLEKRLQGRVSYNLLTRLFDQMVRESIVIRKVSHGRYQKVSN